MNMQRTEMAHNLLLCVEADVHEILIAEYQGTPLRSEKSKLIQASTVKLRELDSVDFRSHMRRKLPDLGGIFQKVGKLGIGTMARIEVLERTDVFYLLERIIECC